MTKVKDSFEGVQKNQGLTRGSICNISPGMRRTKLALKLIHSITKKLLKEKTHPKRKGRPKTYPDALIISIFLYQILRGLSFREVLEEAKRTFKNVPTLSDYHYRVKKMPKTTLQNILFLKNSFQKEQK